MILLIFVADHIETLDTPKAAGLSSCSTTSSEVGQGRWLEGPELGSRTPLPDGRQDVEAEAMAGKS